jgi:DNA-directed RNA polymerase subunit RPC12/RpoP
LRNQPIFITKAMFCRGGYMNIHEYHCPSCGAELTFSATTQHLECGFCGSSFTPEELADAVNENAAANAGNAAGTSGVNQYQCPSCGAAVVTGDNVTAATRCYYCHAPVVLADRLTGEFKPNGVLPFLVEHTAAVAALQKHVAKRWFVPKSFKQIQAEDVQGVYIPFWVTDCDVSGRVVYHCRLVRTHRRGKQTYTTTKIYEEVRGGDVQFVNVQADASTMADDALMDSLEPFDLGQVKQFDMSYLSGYSAQRYDVGKEQIAGRINERVFNTTMDTFKNDVNGYSSVSVLNHQLNTHFNDWRMLLLPVWILKCKYGNEMLTFAQNGQSGKLVGKLPIVWWKVILMSVILVMLISAVTLLPAFIHMISSPVVDSDLVNGLGLTGIISCVIAASAPSATVKQRYNIRRETKAKDYVKAVNITQRNKRLIR